MSGYLLFWGAAASLAAYERSGWRAAVAVLVIFGGICLMEEMSRPR